MDANLLVGAWRLLSWESRDAAGQVTYPFGQDPVGLLTYTADGYMNAVLTCRDRAPFAAGDILQGSIEEQAAAAATCIAYAGRYEQREGMVVHHVEVSLFPNWIGTSQERLCALTGNRLSLSTHLMLQHGSARRAYLVWERAESTA